MRKISEESNWSRFGLVPGDDGRFSVEELSFSDWSVAKEALLELGFRVDNVSQYIGDSQFHVTYATPPEPLCGPARGLSGTGRFKVTAQADLVCSLLNSIPEFAPAVRDLLEKQRIEREETPSPGPTQQRHKDYRAQSNNPWSGTSGI
jgi:hypothetical protein